VSEPFEYLANAQDCLRRASNAPNRELRERWLGLAESWLGMVPKDLRSLMEMLEKAAPAQSTQPAPSNTRH
jgi:hypothetical protein